MDSLKQARRLKAEMLKAAVQENADLIADRLPTPLRPARRLMAFVGRKAWLLVLPASLVLGSAQATHPPEAAQPVPAAQMDAPPEDVELGRSPETSPDLSLLKRTLHPRALALGVRRVVLDPGHGGEDVGTLSASGLREKDVTLDLAQRAQRLLTQQGLIAILTRDSDQALSLRERSAAANRERGDIFVSIHLNALARAGARGVEMYYLGPGGQPEHEAVAAAENQHSGYALADMRALLDNIYAGARRDESMRLAQSVQASIVRRLQAGDPAMTDRGVKTAPFVVLVGTEMPAILAEVSCLSNAEEAERLGTDAYRQTIADALVMGIQGFIDQTRVQLTKERNSQ